MFNEIKYPSKDNLTQIHAVMWIPTGKINAILQIEHGMTEHITRYGEIAEILNNAGILVCGEDHLGHGLSVIDNAHYGYFAAKRGDRILIDDAISLTKIMKNKYPSIPYFILGHSFGSFMARNYIQQHPDINGAIIMGSAYHSPIKMNLAIIITVIHQFYHHGWFHRSKFLKNMTTGNLGRFFEEKTPNCWLTKDDKIIESYNKDPLCSFNFTCNGYLNMFRLIRDCNKLSNLKKVNKNIPILIVSGKDDPVGNFGKSVMKIEKLYKKAKFTSVKLKLYNNMRHEILNESERVIAINDITTFINTNILKAKK